MGSQQRPKLRLIHNTFNLETVWETLHLHLWCQSLLYLHLDLPILVYLPPVDLEQFALSTMLAMPFAIVNLA